MSQATEDRKKSQQRSEGMSTLQLVAVAGSLGLTLFVNIIVGIFIGRLWIRILIPVRSGSWHLHS